MDNYKKQLSDKVKQSIVDWISRLKIEHPNQLIRSNFKILFPKGFKAGQNIIQIVTPAKRGKRLIGEIGFYLLEDLVLNVDEVDSSVFIKTECRLNPERHFEL